jgi:hypothetical protein
MESSIGKTSTQLPSKIYSFGFQRILEYGLASL